MATVEKIWTLAEVHSLPDDGNKYELVRGALFVTPPPTPDHEDIAALLSRVLEPYVLANSLGLVYRPRAVMQFEGSEVEPDLMVRARRPSRQTSWEQAPTPLLIIEILSPSTRRRDIRQKRDLYLDAGVGEYWMVDPERREIVSIASGRDDVRSSDTMSWHPGGAAQSLSFAVADIFDT